MSLEDWLEDSGKELSVDACGTALAAWGCVARNGQQTISISRNFRKANDRYTRSHLPRMKLLETVTFTALIC